jgi:inner membrane protein involved in colicin E2 resistance
MLYVIGMHICTCMYYINNDLKSTDVSYASHQYIFIGLNLVFFNGLKTDGLSCHLCSTFSYLALKFSSLLPISLFILCLNVGCSERRVNLLHLRNKMGPIVVVQTRILARMPVHQKSRELVFTVVMAKIYFLF